MYSSYYDRYKDVFTEGEYAIITSNLQAFVANFGYPVIQKGELEGWFVFLNGNSSPMMYCYDIANLDGWLWGCVQGANHRLPMYRQDLHIKWIDGEMDAEETEEE